MWLLDTDHVSLLLRQDPKVQSELAQRLSQTTVSIITLQKVFNGWIGALNQSDESQAGTIYKYHQLWLAHEFFKAIPVCNSVRSICATGCSESIGSRRVLRP
jgi:tRNA(fMet)-specific endonuclease VapC